MTLYRFTLRSLLLGAAALGACGDEGTIPGLARGGRLGLQAQEEEDRKAYNAQDAGSSDAGFPWFSDKYDAGTTGTGVDAGASKDAGASDGGASDSGARDASVDAAAAKDAGISTACGNPLPSASPNVINETQMSSSYPGALGGRLVDGIYYLSRYEIYAPSRADDYTRRRMLVVSGNVIATTNVDDGKVSTSTLGTYTISDAKLNIVLSCPSSMSTTVLFTATSSQIWLFDPSEPNIQIYTLSSPLSMR